MGDKLGAKGFGWSPARQSLSIAIETGNVARAGVGRAGPSSRFGS